MHDISVFFLKNAPHPRPMSDFFRIYKVLPLVWHQKVVNFPPYPLDFHNNFKVKYEFFLSSVLVQ